MIWLIILILSVLIASLFFINVRLCVEFQNDISVYCKILFVKIQIFPEKKVNPNPKNFSIKALKKRQKKKKEVKKENTTPPSEKTTKEKIKDIVSTAKLIKNIVERIIRDFARYLHIEVSELKFTVGSDDAAKTAVLYGIVCGIAANICELLSNVTNFSPKSRDSITVTPDYVFGRCEAEINIRFRLKVWQIILLGTKAMAEYSKQKSKS